jgi:nitrile hydratase accessory protein
VTDRRTAALIEAMAGPEAPRRADGEMVFEAPWQGRAVAMALGLVERLGVGWEEFRRRLVAEIEAQPGRPYYESWLAALESLAADHGVGLQERAPA